MSIRLLTAASAVLFASWTLAAPPCFRVVTDHANALYHAGDEATFVVTVTNAESGVLKSGVFDWRLDNFGNAVVAKGRADLAKGNPFVVKGSLGEPGFLRLSVSGGELKKPFVWGVGYDPEKIEMGGGEPADFDAFWADAIAKLDATVPPDPQLVHVPERSTGAFDFWRISFATYGGTRVWGFLSVPKDKSKAPFRTEVSVSAAGEGRWTMDMDGSPDKIRMHFTVHAFEPPKTVAEVPPLHARMREELKAKYGIAHYASAGIAESREDYYYYRTILGINRAVDWLAAREDVDRSRFGYSGTSQGGGFGWYLCGLNRHFTAAVLYVPAISDTLGFLQGDRQSGWPRIIENQPPEKREAALGNAPYFDGANFAPRIRIPIRVVVGFADSTCAPCSVYATYNRLGSSDKGIVHAIGQGHGVRPEWYRAGQAWLDAVVGAPGGRVKPFRPGERVVFFGDSITHGGKYLYYLQLLENLRHPGSGVRLLNGGISGGSAASGLPRFEADILGKRPDRIFVMFGMNDVGRGNYADFRPSEAAAQARRRALDGYAANQRKIAELVQAAGKGLVLVTPSPYDQYSDAQAERLQACNDPGLATAADIVRRLAVEKGTDVVEFHRPLTRLLRENPDRELCGSDRVHPRNEGHLLMAALVWNAMGEDGVLAETRLAAADNRAKAAYAPKALPLPKCAEYLKDDEIYPLTEKFNREMLSVDGLAAGDYVVCADGRPLKTFTADELKRGVNLALLDTPSQRRSQQALKTMYELQDVSSRLRGLVHMELVAAGRKVDVRDFAATTNALWTWIAELEAKKNPSIGYYRGQVKAYCARKPQEAGMKAREEALYRRMAEESTPVAFELSVEPATSVLHVDAATGDDAGDGSSAKPFRTLERARDQVRAWKKVQAFPPEGVKVVVEGTFDYPDADRPFALGAEDGGLSADARVEYVAGPRGATVTGAYRLPAAGFRPVADPAVLARLRPEVRERVRVCDLAALGVKELKPLPAKFGSWAEIRMELFAGGRSMPIARYPNAGWLTITNVVDRGTAPLDWSKGEWEFGVRGGTFVCDDPRLDAWDVAKGVFIHGYWCYDWASDTLKVAKIDRAKRTMTSEGVHTYGIGNAKTWQEGTGRRYYVYNLLEEIDAPGEWYVDRARRLLYFLPPDGLTGDLLLSCGAKDKAVFSLNRADNVTFRGIDFRYAGAALKAWQANNVELDGVKASWITGEAASVWGEGTQVRNCTIHDIGGRGLFVQGGDRRKLTPSGIRVTGCEIFRCGRLQRTGGSCLTFQGCGVTVDHNYFHDVPYIAVSYGGNEHRIEYNEVECAMMEAGDGGGMYTGRDWGSQGTKVRYNLFHEFGADGVALRKAQGFETGFEPLKGHVMVMGLYLDDCDSGEFAAHNVFRHAGWAMFNGGGRDNKWHANLTFDSTSAAQYDIRGLRRARPGSGIRDGWDLLRKLQDLDYTNKVWATRYPWLVNVMENDPKLPVGTVYTDNLSFNCADFFSIWGDAPKVLKEKKGAARNVFYGAPGKRDETFFSAKTNAEKALVDYRRQAELERLAAADPLGLQDTAAFRRAHPEFVRIPLDRIGRQPGPSAGVK